MIKLKTLLIYMVMVLTVATAAASSDGYKITVPLSEQDNGSTIFLVNYDNGEKLDSLTVTDDQAIFTGKVDKPIMANFEMVGKRLDYHPFILENADFTYDFSWLVFSPLNEERAGIKNQLNTLYCRIQELSADSASEAKVKELQAEYNTIRDRAIAENPDSPIGYDFFLDYAYGCTLPELKAALEKYPSFKGYKRIQRLVTVGENKLLRQPGTKFVDFEIADGATVQRLSDYVGKGKYVLVDFWASWCGPCIRETKVLKEILDEYGPKGLAVLGVAVWDEPQDSKTAIKTHQLPWPQIINAQWVPTDLYGISAIPVIILFGPDGTILSRDKRGKELKAEVSKYLDGNPIISGLK